MSVLKAHALNKIYNVQKSSRSYQALNHFAMIHKPAIVLADEPTGNLDSKSAKSVMDSLGYLNQYQNATIMTVTHDPFTTSYCNRVVFIKDGKFFSEIHKGENRQAFFQKIVDSLSVLGGDFDEVSSPRA